MKINKIFFLAGLLLSILVLSTALSYDRPDERLSVKIPKSLKPALNNGCGLVLTSMHHYDRPIEWYNDYIAITYGRFHWSVLEPQRSSFNFAELGDWVQHWKKKGFRVSFGVMSCSQGKQSTPDWIFNEGLQFVNHTIKKGKDRGSIIKDPIFWDEKYFTQYASFIKALGIYLNGGNDIESIDIRGLGTWGEMHLIGYSKDDLSKSHFNIKRYSELYKKMIDLYCDSFPNTQLFLNLGHLYKEMYPYVDLADYAVKRGVGLRFDGLQDRYIHVDQYIATDLFQKYSNPNIIPTLYEFARKERDPGVVSQCLKNALRDRVSYLHLNLEQLFTLDPVIIEEIKAVSLQIGYRFIIEEFVVDKFIWLKNHSNTIRFSLALSNKGVASCQFNSIGSLVLKDRNKNSWQSVDIQIATKGLLAGEKKFFPGELILPNTIPTGEYDLFFSLQMERNNKIVILGNSPETPTGKYFIAHAKIEQNETGKIIELRNPFE